MVSDYTHKIVVKEDGVQSLIIVPAMPKDSGEWTVIAQNRAGRTSVSVTLTVDGEAFPCLQILYVVMTWSFLLDTVRFTVHSQRKPDTTAVC